MRNIIIRAGMSPFDRFDAPYIMANNSIGGNVGNLVYQYSIFRTLMTKDTTLTPDYYDFHPRRADEINEKYDAYVIPLADAFREDFVPSLRKYTQLIKKLKIPVYVIGAGLRAPFEPKLNEGFPFDEDVKAFVKAVLEKSNTLGLRGQITADYLTRLGFREGIDHTVIGCPSMYTFGRELHIRDTKITKDSLVSVNSSRKSPKHVLDFITRSMKDYPNHFFIPQWMKELRMTYAGGPALAAKSTNYPVTSADETYQNDRVRFFLNVPTWLDFLRQADLSFGARLHGNITAAIAGTPSLIIPKDARMRELTEYHQLTHVWHNDIKENTKLEDLIETADFQAPAKRQAANFDNFISFLDKNNLAHIYQDEKTPETAPLDEKLKAIELNKPVTTIAGADKQEVARRLVSYVETVENNNNKKIKALQNQIKDKDKKIKKYQGTLGRKAVRFALRTADKFSRK